MAEIMAEGPIAYSEMAIREDELDAVRRDQDIACKSLWASVMERAVKDACGRVTVDIDEISEWYGVSSGDYMHLDTISRRIAKETYKEHCEETAVEWLFSEDEGIGSYKWISMTLGRSHTSLRAGVRALLNRQKREKEPYWASW